MFKRSLLFTILLSFLSVNGWSTSLVICQMREDGADEHDVAGSMGGKIVDWAKGGIYLMSMPSLPAGPLPAEVKYVETDKTTTIPNVRRAIMSVQGPIEDWYRYQPAMRLVHLS